MCDLNRAPAEEIAALAGVGLQLAHQLTLWRPYQSWADVERVPGLDREAVAALRACGAVIARPA